MNTKTRPQSKSKSQEPEPEQEPEAEPAPDVPAEPEGSPEDLAAFWEKKAGEYKQESGSNKFKALQAQERLGKLEREIHDQLDKAQKRHARDTLALKSGLASVSASFLKARDQFLEECGTKTIPIPLGDGRFFLIRPPLTLAAEDVDLVMDTLKVWRDRLVTKEGVKVLSPQEIVGSLEAALRVELNGLGEKIEAMVAREGAGSESEEADDEDEDE